ncbi:unnamed protein product [Allacma fusca]|uniref:Reverse transcriptase domain-containing protein n=1 Tax=Allacma fusca TaxID=39272 RepID=A0A8J2NRT3_9HEXA|nr:unnamed protein product [Allacma fusca]
MVTHMAENRIQVRDPSNDTTFDVFFKDSEKNPHRFELKKDPKQKDPVEVKYITAMKTEEIFSISENKEYVIDGELMLRVDETVQDINIPDPEKGELKNSIHDNIEIFEDRIGLCNMYTHTLVFKGGVLPPPEKIWVKTRPIPHRYEDGVFKIIRQWIKDGKIVQRQSPYKLGLVFVDKGGGKVRICIDGRPLNEYILRHSTEVPNISNMRYKFRGMKWFTIFDFNCGFLQIGLDENQQIVLSFVVDGIPFVMTVVGFGTEDSLAAFVYALLLVLKGCEHFTGVYVDDVVVFSRTLKEHLEHIRIFMEKVKKAGMTLNLKKTQWLLKGYEKSYSIMELELLAIVHLLAKNYYLLAGNKVHLYTDNIAVTYLKKNDLLPNRIIKWLLYLDNFRIDIRHIAEFRRFRALQDKDDQIRMWMSREPYQTLLDEKLNLIMIQNRNDRIWRIYVPLKLRKDIIHHYHHEYGHLQPTSNLRNTKNRDGG